MRTRLLMLAVGWMLTGAPAVSAPAIAPAITGQLAQLQAGVARGEITPPPGFATGGYGPTGSVVRGQLTRLYARAVYLTYADSKLLLVSLDALAVAQVFQFKIQAHLRAHDGLALPEASIIVAATHTHHGAGGFFSAAVYNGHASVEKGYSRELHEFMLEQVLAAVCAAVKNAVPADIALGRSVMPVRLLRNRSPETFMLNPGARDLMNKLDTLHLPTTAADCASLQLPEEQPGAWDLAECPRLRAVDRSLVVLEIKNKQTGTPVTTLVFAAVHPTVLYAAAPVFSSDFVGVAMARLEAAGGKDYVAAFFNGAEGDITTRRIRRDLRDLWKNADMFEKAVDDARNATAPLDLTGGIKARIHFAEPGDELKSSKLRLASKPVGGVAALGGAEGDRTILYDLGWREREFAVLATEDHGDKRPAFDSRLIPGLNLTWLLTLFREDYARILPLGLASIGVLKIASVPTELSTAAGDNVRKAVLAHPADPMVIIGLANAFGSYTATSAEYARQDYMGATTFWGRDEAPFFAEVLSKLNDPISDPTFTPRRGRADHHPGGGTDLAPYRVGAKRPTPDDGLDLLLRDKDGHPVRNLPYVSWRECTDDDPFEATARRKVKIVTSGSATVHADGLGDIVIVLRAKPQHGVSEWSAIWTDRLRSVPKSGQVKFQIHSGDGHNHESLPFDAATYAGNPTPVNQCPVR